MILEDIKDRAQGLKAGGVKESEVEYARSILLSGKGDIFAALYIVGLCGSANDSVLIEPYILPEKSGQYSDLALKVLCRYLGLVDRYRVLIRHLVFSDGDVGWVGSRNAAIALSDVYLKDFEDNQFGCRLVEIMLNKNSGDRIQARGILVDILGIADDLDDKLSIEEGTSETDLKKIVDAAEKHFSCNFFNIKAITVH